MSDDYPRVEQATAAPGEYRRLVYNIDTDEWHAIENALIRAALSRDLVDTRMPYASALYRVRELLALLDV